MAGNCSDTTIADNHVYVRPMTPGLPRPQPGMRLHGNIVDPEPQRRAGV